MLRTRSFDLVHTRTFDTESRESLKLPKLRGSVGADLNQFAKDQAIVTDPEETRRRRTIRLVRLRGRSWGFTLQTYGIRNKRSREVEVMSYVDYVEIGGAAYVAGMRRGDIILSVNGESVEMCTHGQLVQKIQKSGQTLRLVVLFEDCCHKVELHERYLKLKRMLSMKIKELRKLEEEERQLSQGIPLSRAHLFRQSTFSSTSSDWDIYSEVTSPAALDSIPANQFAFRDDTSQSLSDVSTLSSSTSTGSCSVHANTTRSTDEEYSNITDGGLPQVSPGGHADLGDPPAEDIKFDRTTGPVDLDIGPPESDCDVTTSDTVETAVDGSVTRERTDSSGGDKPEFVQSGQSDLSQGSEDGFQHLYTVTRCAECITQVSQCPHQVNGQTAGVAGLHVPESQKDEGGSMTNLAVTLGSEITKITSQQGASPQLRRKVSSHKKGGQNVFYIESDSEDSVSSMDVSVRRKRWTSGGTSEGSESKKLEDISDDAVGVDVNTGSVSDQPDIVGNDHRMDMSKGDINSIKQDVILDRGQGEGQTDRNDDNQNDHICHRCESMMEVGVGADRKSNVDDVSKGGGGDLRDDQSTGLSNTKTDQEINQTEMDNGDVDFSIKHGTDPSLLSVNCEHLAASGSANTDDNHEKLRETEESQETLDSQFLSALEAFDLVLAASESTTQGGLRTRDIPSLTHGLIQVTAGEEMVGDTAEVTASSSQASKDSTGENVSGISVSPAQVTEEIFSLGHSQTEAVEISSTPDHSQTKAVEISSTPDHSQTEATEVSLRRDYSLTEAVEVSSSPVHSQTETVDVQSALVEQTSDPIPVAVDSVSAIDKPTCLTENSTAETHSRAGVSHGTSDPVQVFLNLAAVGSDHLVQASGDHLIQAFGDHLIQTNVEPRPAPVSSKTQVLIKDPATVDSAKALTESENPLTPTEAEFIDSRSHPATSVDLALNSQVVTLSTATKKLFHGILVNEDDFDTRL